MIQNASQHYLENVVSEFRLLKKQADRAIEQLDDAQLFVTIDPESNSVAILMKHLAGNMRSRWTDFLTTDGEKPDRFRDQEFILPENATRAELLRIWEEGWRILFDALMPLGPEDVTREIIIRREPHTVIQAINRQLTHYASHVGQIVFLAKHLKSADWKTLSVPRGQSEQFNQKMIERLEKERAQQGPIPRYYSVFHMNEQEKIGFSTQRFKGTKVQRPICRELFEPLSL
jgi:hypothetical protein